MPFKQSVPSSKGGFPFVAFSNADKMVGMLEVDLGIDSHQSRSVEEVRGKWKWVSVFLGELVQPLEIYTQLEGAILLLDEKDRSSVRGSGWTDESY